MGKWYDVLTDEGEVFQCQIKGKFRLKGIRTTNPVAVGDRVAFTEEEGHGVISEIEPRSNYIIRRSVNLSKEAHIIASNIDHAWLVVTLKDPPTSTGFIDRFLVTAEAYSIKTSIVFNKVDIYGEKENQLLDYYRSIYESVGYKCYAISALSDDWKPQFVELFKDKNNLLSGHSGAGKSTFINSLMPGVNIKTQAVSSYHSKGTHTTTFAEMHVLPFGGFIVDTPGIKGFGLVDIEKEQLHHYFPEFFDLISDCKFHNCVHLNEPGCAVKLALENEEISEERYKNYWMMYYDDENPYRQ